MPKLEEDKVAATSASFADEVLELELLPKLLPPLLRAATLSRKPAEKANKQIALVKIMVENGKGS